MTYRVEIADQVDRDADAILEWLHSQHATDAAVAWFRGLGEAIDSLAVLPFLNANADPNTEYLSDGISEELINALSKLPQLQVVARPSSFAFKGKNEDVRQIGQALHVATVLGGSVRRAANRLRVTARHGRARRTIVEQVVAIR